MKSTKEKERRRKGGNLDHRFHMIINERIRRVGYVPSSRCGPEDNYTENFQWGKKGEPGRSMATVQLKAASKRTGVGRWESTKGSTLGRWRGRSQGKGGIATTSTGSETRKSARASEGEEKTKKKGRFA